ncbi:MAG: autotransporter domain-containing protein [Rickettsiales bacterium]|nr:autotransporter domain-containing protein [Rickettsiales bacterium]
MLNNFIKFLFLASFSTFISINNSFAIDYTNNDLSGQITQSGDFDNVTINNNQTLVNNDANFATIYFPGDIQGDIQITNTGSLSATGSNSGIIYFPSLGQTGNPTMTIDNQGTMSTTGEYSIPIYIPGDDNSYSFDLTNSGTISAQTPHYDAIYVIARGDSESITIDNSGDITNSLNNAIYLIGDNSEITNSGNITAASSSDYAMYFSGDNATVNIDTGSNISGKIFSNGSNNNLNFIGSVSLSNYNSLIDSSNLEGSWAINFNENSNLILSSSDSYTINENATMYSITLNSEASLTNNGTLNDLTVLGADNEIILGQNSTLGDINNSGELVINSSSSDISYSSAISGSGSLTKTGSSTLELTGTNTMSGSTTVSQGELKVNGSISSSSVTLNSGTTISGTGTIGDVTLNSGATLAAGNSIGTLNVSGDLTLNSGSNSNFEFNSQAIDKVSATGNVSLSGNANFDVYGRGGYFVIRQNIIETSGGSISGTFDNINTDDSYVTNLDYNSANVVATISRKLDSNVIDAPISAQNALAVTLARSLDQELQNIDFNKKFQSWINVNRFDSSRSSIATSSGYATNGYFTSVGIIKNNEDSQIFLGLINANATTSKLGFLGHDNIDSNAITLGYSKKIRDFFNIIKVSFGSYDFDTNRNVSVNGNNQNASAAGRGDFYNLNLSSYYKIPLKLSGDLKLFSTILYQKTNHGGYSESGLDYGNVRVADSSLTNLNYEIGTTYANLLPKFININNKSSYSLSVSMSKNNAIDSKKAVVTDGENSYELNPRISQNIMVGFGGNIRFPFDDSNEIIARIDRRQNEEFRELNSSIIWHYKF